MPKLPTVAIIGRPNTGKSTLFNRLLGRRRAIVSDVPGTTRDQIASKVEGEEVDYLLVDTGGMGGGTEDIDMEDDVHAQSLLALEHADLILFTVNGKEELTGSDFSIVDTLRKKKRSHVPLLVVVTKLDNPDRVDEVLPGFYQLGIGDEYLAISSLHGAGVDALEQKIEAKLRELHFTKSEEHATTAPARIALVGRPNVGKSSLVNAFMSETQRKESPLLVSEIPGTTRDSTDTVIRYHEQDYIFVDTAGIKRRKSTDEGIETFAYFRSMQAVQECDVCVLVIDASVPVSKQDKRIAGMAIEEGKSLMILANKIDTLKGEHREQALKHIRFELQFAKFAPILPCSATSRDGLLKIFDLIESVKDNRFRRIPTKDLHRWFRDAVTSQPMEVLSKSKFITQGDEVPPTFIIFVKDPKRVQLSQLRYLDKRLREMFAFEGTPIRWITKPSDKEEK